MSALSRTCRPKAVLIGLVSTVVVLTLFVIIYKIGNSRFRANKDKENNKVVFNFDKLLPKKTKLCFTPTLLPMPLFGANEFNPDVKVVRVEGSFNHLAAITNKGDLYMWGKNTDGCLGLGHRADQYFPFRVCVPAFVRKVSLGINHTIIIGSSLV
ncbi:unnamed protein product [Medioppia subpectinata]|uniref:Uncharacterized protein n=1 Tax=Medioppia subpectinata TaxID=1979941 RepID=A0A7R9PY24_9ACAR|nr:unnamed protein product [Medioppia subpectinata]CAG2105632.1 unnamed protein product [Medioppia subpectinata]